MLYYLHTRVPKTENIIQWDKLFLTQDITKRDPYSEKNSVNEEYTYRYADSCLG